MCWCTETGTTEARDAVSSWGVNRASAEDGLHSGTVRRVVGINVPLSNRPHAKMVLHHKFVQRLCGMGHVHLSIPLPKVGLKCHGSPGLVNTKSGSTDLLGDIRQCTRMVEMETANACIRNTDRRRIEDILGDENRIDGAPVEFIHEGEG